MYQFNDTHREHFNDDLFKRENEDIIKSIYNVVKSCEQDKCFTLKLLKFEVIEDYEAIYNALRNHEERRRRKNDKTENLYDFINIKDTDMMLIRIIWLIRHNDTERQEIDNKTIQVINPTENMEVLIAVPRFVRKYYFRLNGNYYTTVFQIVDGSTYNNSTANQSKVDTVSLKTLFSPVRIFRGFVEHKDLITGETIKIIEYNSNIFNTSTNALYYILANYGLYGALQFLNINCVNITSAPVTDNRYVCFCKNGIYVSAPRVCFQDAMVQSLVATLLSGIMKDTTINSLYDQRYWLQVLGMAYKNASVDKGLFVLDSVDGIFDLTTQEDLHLPPEDKENIYTAIRWMLREFSNLRVKEITNETTKRIRISDYIAQVYGTRMNHSLYGLSDLGRRVTLTKIKQRIYTNPMFLMNNIAGLSNLINYRDMVNDNDATVALKYTYKGISGLGEDGSSVQPIYRYVDPSHIGILDLDTSSGSDPGMSGMICPMTKIYNHNFSQYEEPNEWASKYIPIEEKFKAGTIRPISFDESPDSPQQYISYRDQMVQENIDYNKIYCPITDLDDPSIVYSSVQEIIDQSDNTEVEKSLFTIVDDDYEDDYFNEDE